MIARRLKRGALAGLRASGVDRWVGGTEWRRRRLLILCYHGVALENEHRWRPKLFITPDLLRARLARIRDGGYRVLPLAEGVERLREGTLPPRSVCITFDDGLYDFYARAWPILRQFGFPATVYLSTYYSRKRVPVHTLMCSYVLWTGRRVLGRSLDVLGTRVDLDVAEGEAREATLRRILDIVAAAGVGDEEKQRLVHRLADVLEVDFRKILDARVLQLMNGDEVREISEAGVDVQLHTHRHRSPLDESLYRREIHENRAIIRELTGRDPRHFCFPSGDYRPEFVHWLHSEGIESATTCDPAIATRRSPRLLLPRLVDHAGLSTAEFDAWLCGIGPLLARSRIRSSKAYAAASGVEDAARIVGEGRAARAATEVANADTRAEEMLAAEPATETGLPLAPPRR